MVTGANKGIGYELVRALADRGLTVVLTARDQGRGQAAVESLKAAGLKSVWFHQLDVVSSQSVDKLATWLKTQFGGIDILVSAVVCILHSLAKLSSLFSRSHREIKLYECLPTTWARNPVLVSSAASDSLCMGNLSAVLFVQAWNDGHNLYLKNSCLLLLG